MSRQQSGLERFLELMKMPIGQRRAYINEFPVLMATVFQGVGLIAALIAALLLLVFLFGDGGAVGREPGSGRGDSSGGGRNDDTGFDDGYDAPEHADFDFAVMLNNEPLRTWKHTDVEDLDKHKVNVPGEGEFEGTGLQTLLDESGEDGWESVLLMGMSSEQVNRDDISDDWILILEPPNPGLGLPLATYTLLVPDRPRDEWPVGIDHFEVYR